MPKLPEKIVMSAGVDIHDHLREPSPTNHSETFESGTLQALLGGYIVLADMSNTPGWETWTFGRLTEKERLINESAYVYVAAYSGAQPESDNITQLGPMAGKSIGVKFYLGPTTGYDRDLTIRDVQPQARRWHEAAPDKPIMVHRGNADIEEVIAVVAKELRHPLHVCHVNHPDEVKAVAEAKKAGLPVTCGVCPHHLFMNSHHVMTKGSIAEMQPPLASQSDAEKLWHLAVKGDIDVIETDHAPHPYEKKVEAEQSKGTDNPINCYGVPGIMETITQLLNQARLGKITPERIEELTSTKPAEIIGVRLSSRTKATWTDELYQIDDAPELGRSYVSPYVGNWAVGRIVSMTSCGRELVAGDSGLRKLTRPFLMRGQTI